MRIALYQPEIAGNVGAVLRLGACMGVGVDIIEPTGFPFSDARLRRSAMDYIDAVDWRRHPDFEHFFAQSGRLVLLTTKGTTRLHDFAFSAEDVLLFGSEGSGIPAELAARAHARLRIPIRPAVRSFNLAVSAGIAVAEALRQINALPE